MKHIGSSQRQLRVGEQVRHAIARILQREILLDDALRDIIISISEVRMSSDLKIATCFVSFLNIARDTSHSEVIQAFNRHNRFIRREVGRQMRQLKYTPELRFRLDNSFDNFSKIDALLRSPEVVRDLRNNTEFKD